ncbi:hypothetical protein BGZ67_009167 [Mortierella alpina]|nr:hypothetical protein BGZ67_009167 [Mortierella alpina]
MSSPLTPSPLMLAPSSPSSSSLQLRRATSSQFDLAAANKVFHIPELVDIIASYLTPSALAACALLTRELNTLFTPYIWGNLHITTRDQESRFLQHDARATIARNREMIRSVSIGSHRVMTMLSLAFKTPPTNIRSLKLNWQGHDYNYDNGDPWVFGNVSNYCPEWDVTLTHLLTNCPRLETLDMDLTIINLPNIETAFQGLKHLKTLRLRSFRGAQARPATLARIMDALPTGIETLTIDMRLSHDESDVPEPPFVPQGSRTNIKNLTINAGLLRIESTLTQRIFYRCQALKSLSVTGVFSQRPDVSRLSEVLLTFCPVLDELNIDIEDYVAEDEDLAEIISSRLPAAVTPALSHAAPTTAGTLTPPTSPQHDQLPYWTAWKSIQIRAPKFGTLTSAAIVSHAPTLERVVLGIRGLEVHDLQSLLASAPNLRTLVSLSARGPKFNDTFLKPASVGDRPWICSESLEELQLSLRPGNCKRSSREALMDRLGGLERLRVLHLHNGVALKGGFTDFSLDGGDLRRLEGLKCLEAFELKHLRHRIGGEERAWMGQHWPKLKRVCLDCEWRHHEDEAPPRKRRFRG